MKILRLEIREFGGIVGLTFELGKDINVISGAEHGLIPGFVRFLFYGLPRTKSPVFGCERAFALGHGGVAEGAMDIETEDGALLKIERYTSALRQNDDICVVSDAKSGEELWRGANAGEYIFGVPAPVFDRLVYTAPGEDGLAGLAAVSAAIRGIVIPADDAQSVTKALNRLRGARRRLTGDDGRSGRVAELREKCAELAARLETARESAQNRVALNATVEKYSRVTAETGEKLGAADAACAEYEELLAWRRFGELHAAEADAAALKEEKEELIRKYGRDGRYPDTAYADELAGAADDMIRAAAGISGAERELSELGRDEGDHGQDMYAEEVEAEGGPDAAAESFRVLAARHRALRGTGVGLLGGGVVLFVVALASYFLFSGSAAWLTLPLALGISALGAVMAVLGCVVLRAAAASGAEIGRFVERFGLDPAQYRTADVDAATEQIRSYAAFCLEVRSDRSGRRDRQRELSAAVADERAWLAAARSDGKALLEAFGTPADVQNDNEMIAALRAASANAAARAGEMNDMNGRIRQKNAELRRLSASLEGHSEEKLAARMTEENVARLSALDYDALKFKRDAVAAQLDAGLVRISDAKKNLSAIEARAENPARAANDLTEAERELAAAEASAAALAMAQEKLEAASDILTDSIVPIVLKRANALLPSVFGGRYASLTADADLTNVSVTENHHRLEAPLSGAAADAASFALRAALTQVLFGSELPPVLCAMSGPEAAGARELLSASALLADRGSQVLVLDRDGSAGRQLAAEGVACYAVSIEY